MGLVAASVALIPLGALISAARDPKLRHRSPFTLRFSAFAVAVTLPELVLECGSLAGAFRSGSFIIPLGGLMWGLALLPLASFLLFHPPGFDPGQSDEGGEGPDSGEDPPSPTPPIGGLPLPDAEQSRTRLRGARPRRPSLTPRRRVHRPERRPTRVAQLHAP